MESNASEELRVQLKVFYEHRDEDFDEFAQRFDNIRLELDDVNECFELIKNMVMETPAEPFFLSILQHLLTVRDDCVARCVRIQTCVSSQTRAANQTRASCQRRSQSVQGKMGEWRQNSSFL